MLCYSKRDRWTVYYYPHHDKAEIRLLFRLFWHRYTLWLPDFPQNIRILEYLDYCDTDISYYYARFSSERQKGKIPLTSWRLNAFQWHLSTKWRKKLSLGWLYKGSLPVRKVQFFWTLFKKPLTPPPLSFEHYVVNFSEGILTKVRKRLSRQLSTK